MEKKNISMTTRYAILFAVLLAGTNILLGVVMMRQSVSIIQSLVQKNMLSVSNTAAALLDGDELGALTEEDVGSPAFNEIKEKLAAFQDNVDIEFIYAVRQSGEDLFTFTVDPDPVSPGEFGEEVVVTDALRSAASGVAKVDDEPAQDEWGNFYSSYSPVFDSKGEVAGIVGVDFNAEWYERQIRDHTMSILLVTIISLCVVSLVVLIAAGSIRRQLRILNSQLSLLSKDVDELEEELASESEYIALKMDSASEEAASSNGKSGMSAEIAELSRKIQTMHVHMERYLRYIHKKAYTDGLTGMGNTSAYLDVQKEIEGKIKNGTAAFSVALFDINFLKAVNDNYGHANGDRIIKGAARAIAKIFGKTRTYRIGGDEFSVVVENMTEEEMKEKLCLVDEEAEAFNARSKSAEGTLSLSSGCSSFRTGEDNSFKMVAVRADKIMYEQKNAFHMAQKERNAGG